MPEQIYVELESPVIDIPPETWIGVDSNDAVQHLARRIPETVDPSGMGLIELASHARTDWPPADPERYERVQALAPRLCQILDSIHKK